MDDRDAELRSRSQRWDTAAFTPLVHRRYSLARGFACSLLRDLHHAEDAVQVAFAEAYTSLPGLDAPGAFSAGLRSIVRHRCMPRLRQRALILGPDLQGLHAARLC